MLLTPDMERAERMRSMALTFQRANTALVGMLVPCHVENSPYVDAPAWSDGEAITFNLAKIGETASNDDLIKITGLNFHELAHILYTPRRKDWLSKQVQNDGLYQFFNMLEDQRIESMLSSQYTALRAYYVMAVMKYIATGTQESWESAHALTYGRRFLPDAIRDELRKRFKAQDIIDEMEALIDEYRVMVFPRDNIDGLRVIRRYAELLRTAFGHQHQFADPNDHGSSSGRPDMTEGEIDDDEQDVAAQWVEHRDDEEQWDDEDGSGNGDGDEESDDDGDGSGDSDDDGDGDESDKGGKSGRSDDTSDGDDPANGAGGRGEHVDPSTDEGLRAAAQAAMDAVANSAEVKRDIAAKQQTINANRGQIPSIDTRDYAEHTPDPSYAFASVGFGNELGKLWADSDPGWHTHQSSGRINLRRAMTGSDLDVVFDRWDEGKVDANSIEMVMLVDYSWSMLGQMNAASQALWAVKKAVEGIGGEVTVIGFSNDAATFYNKEEKAEPFSYRAFGAGSGTWIEGATEQARYLFEYSEKRHRILFILTDGAWHDAEEGEAAIKAFNEHGILTALAHLSDYDDADYDDHGCSSHGKINDPMGLIKIAQQIVEQGMVEMAG